jgi:histidinol-phosphatase
MGAWSDGKRIRVAPERAFRDCMISAPTRSQQALREPQAPHLRCFADCWAHAMVARGSIDALVEFGLNRWDIAATEVIVEEAGGSVLIRDNAGSPHKYDTVMGSAPAAKHVAALLNF